MFILMKFNLNNKSKQQGVIIDYIISLNTTIKVQRSVLATENLFFQI